MTFRSLVSDIPFSPSRIADIDPLLKKLQGKHIVLRFSLAASILLLAVNVLVFSTQLVRPEGASSTAPELKPPSSASFSESVMVRNLTRAQDYKPATQATQGEVVEFQYIASNTSPVSQPYVMRHDITDLIEYAYAIDASGGTLNTDTRSSVVWPRINLAPQETTTRTLLLKIKSPIPISSNTTTGLASGDFVLQSTIGDSVATVQLPVPLTKKVQNITDDLPETPLAGLGATLAAFLVVSYFYIRNQVLIAELKAIKKVHNA